LAVDNSISAEADTQSGRLFGTPFVTVLWLGLTVSLLGDYFYRVGLVWNVTTGPGGTARSAVLGAAMALPVAALGMFAGTIIDRYNRPKVMIATDLIRLVVVAFIGVFFIGGSPPVAVVMTGAAVLATSGVCFSPAFQTWLPDLFPDQNRLVRFDALFLTTVSVTGIFGPAAAGLLYPVTGLSGLLLFDAATFAVSAGAVLYVWRFLRRRPAQASAGPVQALRPPSPAASSASAPDRRPGIFKGVGEGLSYIFRNPILRPQFSIYPFVECGTYGLTLILPAYLASLNHSSSWLFGTLLAANAAGRAGGAWLLAHTFLRRYRGRVLSVNLLIQGLALILFCFASSPAVGLPAFALMGLPAGAAQVAMSSWVQVNVERHMRGRAFGTLGSLTLWLMPLGPVIDGWLAGWRSPRFALLATGAAFCLGGAILVSSRAVRTLR